MKTEEKKLTGDPRIDYKWFSRRHETGEAHEIAKQRREKRAADKGLLMEVDSVTRKQRTPQQQLAVLDQRLGAGKGAMRERARLAKQIELRVASVEAVADDKASVRWIEPQKS